MDGDTVSRKLGYVFKDPAILELALTHRSCATPHNERLEFLGDALLNCAIAHELFTMFPQLPEGSLSRARANLVNQETLFKLAQQLELGHHIRVGDGESKSGGRARPSILANTLEAILAAVFLDGGFEQMCSTVHALFLPLLSQIDPTVPGKDPKTLLQEYLQGRKIPIPKYNVIATSGQAHQQEFQVECDIPELGIRSNGAGTNRRSAEQAAAGAAYQKILGT